MAFKELIRTDNEDFCKAKGMIFPRNVLVGHNILPQVGEICDSFDFGKNGIMITGDNTYETAGKTVEDFMREAGYSIDTIKTGQATMINIDAAVKQGKEVKCRFILAVGGGSKIDISKMVAMKLRVPFVSIPTSASHDGIASGRASLKLDMGPKSVDAVSPMGVIADTAVLNRAPYRYLASGCADVISNITALKDWEFARRLRNEQFSSSAFALAQYSATTIIENAKLIKPGLEESVWIAIRPIIISGISMSVAGSSRPTSGAEHMFSHALDILHPGKAMHGEQCGVGSIMMMYLHGGDWMSIRNALMSIGAPVNAEQLGLTEDEVLDALVAAQGIRPDRFTILGDHGIDRRTAEVVAKTTMVI